MGIILAGFPQDAERKELRVDVGAAAARFEIRSREVVVGAGYDPDAWRVRGRIGQRKARSWIGTRKLFF